jgi:hypothetical protein
MAKNLPAARNQPDKVAVRSGHVASIASPKTYEPQGIDWRPCMDIDAASGLVPASVRRIVDDAAGPTLSVYAGFEEGASFEYAAFGKEALAFATARWVKEPPAKAGDRHWYVDVVVRHLQSASAVWEEYTGPPPRRQSVPKDGGGRGGVRTFGADFGGQFGRLPADAQQFLQGPFMRPDLVDPDVQLYRAFRQSQGGWREEQGWWYISDAVDVSSAYGRRTVAVRSDESDADRRLEGAPWEAVRVWRAPVLRVADRRLWAR